MILKILLLVLSINILCESFMQDVVSDIMENGHWLNVRSTAYDYRLHNFVSNYMAKNSYGGAFQRNELIQVIF